MKKYFYLLTISLSLLNCYTYKPGTGQQEEPLDDREAKQKAAEIAKMRTVNSRVAVAEVSATNAVNNQIKEGNTINKAPLSIEEKLQPNKFYKIDVAGQSYKIQVDQWASDTLVAHVIHKPKKILKFHKNQIDQSTIAERRFSKRTADIITVVAYIAIGVGVWALVQ
ncbi:hypothetical protein [Chryseobacterium sp. SC28]|uniref:hypothetical protein n=1 Tax=Chryseobacterium sp. SC28 TaxID=2268028 RepID=UPI000F64AEDD|nr:hypothetical protein [Chryseobacterium sp. SC28]RRQ45139.1 hypothetical protein DTW91_11835 [Chryseobacterium sp. SC28]